MPSLGPVHEYSSFKFNTRVREVAAGHQQQRGASTHQRTAGGPPATSGEPEHALVERWAWAMCERSERTIPEGERRQLTPKTTKRILLNKIKVKQQVNKIQTELRLDLILTESKMFSNVSANESTTAGSDRTS